MTLIVKIGQFEKLLLKFVLDCIKARGVDSRFLLCGAQKFSLIFSLNRVNLYKMTGDKSTDKVANPI